MLKLFNLSEYRRGEMSGIVMIPFAWLISQNCSHDVDQSLLLTMVEIIIIYTSAKEEAREKILGVSFIIYH